MTKPLLVLAASDKELPPPAIDAGRDMVRLSDQVLHLELENQRLRKELAQARGDLEEDQVATAATEMIEWMEKNIPDPAERLSYINTYMTGKYVVEAATLFGPNQAKAITKAARLAAESIEDGELTE